MTTHYPGTLADVCTKLGLTYRKAYWWVRTGLIPDVPTVGSGALLVLTPTQVQALRFVAFIDRHDLAGKDYTHLRGSPVIEAAATLPEGHLLAWWPQLNMAASYATRSHLAADCARIISAGGSVAVVVWDPNDERPVDSDVL